MSDVTSESNTAWLKDLRILRSRRRAAKQLETVLEMWRDRINGGRRFWWPTWPIYHYHLPPHLWASAAVSHSFRTDRTVGRRVEPCGSDAGTKVKSSSAHNVTLREWLQLPHCHWYSNSNVTRRLWQRRVTRVLSRAWTNARPSGLIYPHRPCSTDGVEGRVDAMSVNGIAIINTHFSYAEHLIWLTIPHNN